MTNGTTEIAVIRAMTIFPFVNTRSHEAFLIAIEPNWYWISQPQSSPFHSLHKRSNCSWDIWSWSDAWKCLGWMGYNKFTMPKKNAALYIDETTESACYVAGDLLALYLIQRQWKPLVALTLLVCNLFNTCYCCTLIFILYHGMLTSVSMAGMSSCLWSCISWSLYKTCLSPPPYPHHVLNLYCGYLQEVINKMQTLPSSTLREQNCLEEILLLQEQTSWC